METVKALLRYGASNEQVASLAELDPTLGPDENLGLARGTGPRWSWAPGWGKEQVLARAGRNECIGRRHELLVCVANARREQDAGRGEELHELLGRVARIPPEIVREHVVVR